MSQNKPRSPRPAFSVAEIERWMLRNSQRLFALVPQANGFYRERGTLTIWVPGRRGVKTLGLAEIERECRRMEELKDRIRKEFPSIAKVEFRTLG